MRYVLRASIYAAVTVSSSAPTLHCRSLVSAFAAGDRSLGPLKPDFDEYGYSCLIAVPEGRAKCGEGPEDKNRQPAVSWRSWPAAGGDDALASAQIPRHADEGQPLCREQGGDLVGLPDADLE